MAWLTIRTGRYRLSERVYFDVGGCAGGVTLTLHDINRNMWYSVVVTEEGRLASPMIKERGKHVQPVGATEPVTVWQRFYDDLPDYHLPATGIEFKISYPGTPLATRTVRVLGGWECRGQIMVLYRKVINSVFFDEIGRLKNSRFDTDVRAGGGYLPPTDWERFAGLPEGSHFRIARGRWTKMSDARLVASLANKTFQVRLQR